jgi:hypothetical protein
MTVNAIPIPQTCSSKLCDIKTETKSLDERKTNASTTQRKETQCCIITSAHCQPNNVEELLLLLGTLGAAANDLDLVGLDGLASIVQLEVDIANEEGPDFIAEAICIERSLQFGRKKPTSR